MVGVCKVYILCVGDGLFLIELFDEIGEIICCVGKEYGIIIGCLCCVGWFDLVVMCYLKCVLGIINLLLNLIDVLSGLEMVKICIVYEFDGELIYYYLVSLKELSCCKLVYEELLGWFEDIIGCKILVDLLVNVCNYVYWILELVGVCILIFFVGLDCN